MKAFWLVLNGEVVKGPVQAVDGWTPPPGYTLVLVVGRGEGIGWTWDGAVFHPPNEKRTTEEAIAAALLKQAEHEAALVDAGAEVSPGVRSKLDTASRLDWLGAYVLAKDGVLPLPYTVELLTGPLILKDPADIANAVGALLGAYTAIGTAGIQARDAIRAAGSPDEADAALAAYFEANP